MKKYCLEFRLKIGDWFNQNLPASPWPFMKAILIIFGGAVLSISCRQDSGANAGRNGVRDRSEDLISRAMIVRVMNAWGESPCYGDGEIWVDVYRDGQCDPVATAGLKIINNKVTRILEGPSSQGDNFRFDNLTPGKYVVVATAKRTATLTEEVGPYSFPREQTVSSALLERHGYRIGAEGADTKGSYKIVSISEPILLPEDKRPQAKTRSDSLRYTAWVTKRYYMDFKTYSRTHVSDEEGVDLVLAVVPSPPNDQFEALLRKVLPGTAELIISYALGVDPFLHREAALWNIAMTGQSAAGLLAGNDAAIQKMIIENIGKLVEATKIGSANKTVFLLTVLSAFLPEQVNLPVISIFAGSDDFTAVPTVPLRFSKKSVTGQIKLFNQGNPLKDLQVQCEAASIREPVWLGASAALAELPFDSQETLVVVLASETLARVGPNAVLTGRVRLAYKTQPESGIMTQQYKELAPFPLGGEGHGRSPLRIENICATIEKNMYGPYEPACIVTVRNTAKTPVELLISEASSGIVLTPLELRLRREHGPDESLPFSLGCELLFAGRSTWSSFVSKEFSRVNCRGEDEPDTGPIAEFLPGSAHRFMIFVGSGLRPLSLLGGHTSGTLPMPVGVRVYITEEGFRRVEELSIPYHYPLSL